jgi:hypothetical protein
MKWIIRVTYALNIFSVGTTRSRPQRGLNKNPAKRIFDGGIGGLVPPNKQHFLKPTG